MKKNETCNVITFIINFIYYSGKIFLKPLK